MSALRRLAAALDPADPGFVRRMTLASAAASLFGLGVLAVAGGMLLGRTTAGRLVTAAALIEIGQNEATARIARDLIDEAPGSDWRPYRLLSAALRRDGQVDAQLAVLEEAAAAMPDHWIAQSQWCWYGTLYEAPTPVMDACDRAVAAAPDDRSQAHEHRAVARALAGDRAGAIADLEEALERMPAFDAKPWRVRTRTQWLETLRAGGDPFDEETLATERARY